MANKAKDADVMIENHGSLYLVHGQSDAGKEWMNEHLPEDAQRMGDAVAVEHRYMENIVYGMRGDGLLVEVY
jgi:hypothetical protein